MSSKRLGNPSIPVFVSEYETYVANLEDIWDAARRYAEINRYKVMEGYGVMGVAPFIPSRAKIWLGYLNVPYDEPVEVYQKNESESSWVAEWAVREIYQRKLF